MGDFMRYLLLSLVLAPVLGAQTAGEQHTPADLLEPLHESITISATPLGPRIDPRNAEVFQQDAVHARRPGLSNAQRRHQRRPARRRRQVARDPPLRLQPRPRRRQRRPARDRRQRRAEPRRRRATARAIWARSRACSPELIDEVTLINGPFQRRARRLFRPRRRSDPRSKEKMPDVWTARLQGGNFGTARGFLSWSPNVDRRDALFAYEGSHSDGPFLTPAGLRPPQRDRQLRLAAGRKQRFGLQVERRDERASAPPARLPLDEVAAGRLDRYGAIERRATAARSSRARGRVLSHASWPQGPSQARRLRGALAVRPLFQLHLLPQRSGARRRHPAARLAADAGRQRAVPAAALLSGAAAGC